ncbi:MAG TPA: hypothetical protein VD963_00900 [Phycisphaerales bacterium]|nr:hypothetical protein [Phycisphaerales bacterium]
MSERAPGPTEGAGSAASGPGEPGRVAEAVGRRLVAELAAGVTDLAEAARRAGASALELAWWCAGTEAEGVLRELVRAGEQRSALLVAHARAEAAGRLMELARSEEHPETARKACVDLLKLAPPDPGARGAREADEAGGTALRDLAQREVAAAGEPEEGPPGAGEGERP